MSHSLLYDMSTSPENVSGFSDVLKVSPDHVAQLVPPVHDPPLKRLSPVRRPRPHNEEGSYLEWMSCWCRYGWRKGSHQDKLTLWIR